MRRQQARGNVRQFLDDVQFAVSNEIADVLRLVQREIRDEFTALITELIRTYSDTAQVAQRAAKQHGAEAEQRAKAISDSLEKIEAAGVALAELIAS